ncbi:unnamed protein product [Vitrella brassicaformis CCMP3155]|uniref:Reverse transcriptase domain-containing protein n=1 Tax=Vitrella brassicaformis (strain CCMP3155) TaxID=1169540 RepID=A0A0G4GXC8_VITBC|nr:unnamed protein product [Vitrella brassicaformis CCMP3155]|eukprot:CEM35732.1 unnamed protein product [Vitrella brassicaformis CCMP3155]
MKMESVLPDEGAITIRAGRHLGYFTPLTPSEHIMVIRQLEVQRLRECEAGPAPVAAADAVPVVTPADQSVEPIEPSTPSFLAPADAVEVTLTASENDERTRLTAEDMLRDLNNMRPEPSLSRPYTPTFSRPFSLSSRPSGRLTDAKFRRLCQREREEQMLDAVHSQVFRSASSGPIVPDEGQKHYARQVAARSDRPPRVREPPRVRPPKTDSEALTSVPPARPGAVLPDGGVSLSDGGGAAEHDDAAAAEKKRKEAHEKIMSRLSVPVNVYEGLTDEQKKELIDLLVRYDDVMSKHDEDLGEAKGIKHDIDVGDTPPIRKRAYRVAFSQRDWLRKKLDEMLKAGIITPSSSPWQSPIILVPKKSGGLRLVVDYRALNAVTKPDHYPLPRIDETLNALHGCAFFSHADCKSGFWQIGLTEGAKELTSFVTPFGAFKFERAAMGLQGAPATYQRCMDNVLRNLSWDVACCYMDDLVIMAPTWEEHIRRLDLGLGPPPRA